MPRSLPIFDEEIELYFTHVPHPLVLDIGPGEGKFGRMLRRLQPSARLIGVEIEPAYIQQYRLGEIYDELWVQDATRLLEHPERVYSAVILGDCLEHLRKSAGVDLLNLLVYRSRIILIKFPVQMVQNAWQGHASEAHLSVWSERDFANFDHIYRRRDLMRLCLIRGYLSNTIEWLPENLMRRWGYPSVKAYYDEDPRRWALADQQTLRREACERTLAGLLPAGARTILVDEGQSGLLTDQALPFTERNGQYWGMPPDDAAAIAEIERQRGHGAAFIVFAQPALWALTHYPAMTDHLRRRYRCVLEEDCLVVFDLR